MLRASFWPPCTTTSDFRTCAQLGADVLGISSHQDKALSSCCFHSSAGLDLTFAPPTLSWVAANCVLHC